MSLSLAGFPRRRFRGVVLITALWILALLVYLVLSLVFRVRLSMAITDYRSDEIQARTLVRSGWARALWAIRQDQDVEVDHLGEVWAARSLISEEGLLSSGFGDQARPAVTWRVIDEAGKIPVNTAKPEVLAQLFEIYFGAAIDAELVADYVGDWIDADSEGPGEADDYATWAPEVIPRNDELVSLSELRAVRGITGEVWNGEDLNGNGELDEEEDDGARRPPLDNADGVLQLGLRDLLTVYGEGRLNVNTAPVKTLEAVFRAILDVAEANKIAREIDRARTGSDGILGTEDDTPLRSSQQIAQIMGATLYRQCQGLGVPLGVRSTAFSVVVHVDLEAEKLALTARGMVLRDESGVHRAYFRLEK